MKVVILAGGLGTRLTEETSSRPKPMVEIGGFPILWHIMQIYSYYGHNEFIICAGYKSYFIKEYFSNYLLHNSDLTFNLNQNEIIYHKVRSESWEVTVVDTGENTMTGGRLKRISNFIGNEPFCFTYGDGVGDVNIEKLIEFHNRHGKKATVTAVQPPGRYGTMNIDEELVTSFQEKPKGDGTWINGGFFVLNPEVIELIDGDNTTWEQEPISRLTHEKELSVYKHDGFWRPMDTLRDKIYLEKLWNENQAKWKIW